MSFMSFFQGLGSKLGPMGGAGAMGLATVGLSVGAQAQTMAIDHKSAQLQAEVHEANAKVKASEKLL